MELKDSPESEGPADRPPPLSGIRVVEFSGLGPSPFGAMMLADLGADIVRIQRLGHVNPLGGDPEFDFIYRGRPMCELDLKRPAGRERVVELAKHADILIEGFRPGTMEKLDLGPETLCHANDRLIYARMSGWGQVGPMSQKAGHDINYLALSGGLYPMGPFDGPPSPPLNLVGNFGGGGMFLVAGILAALNERHNSGLGQVIDVSMFDGITTLLTQLTGWMQMGQWTSRRGGNLLDGSAYFYRCYTTADDRHIAVGALERPFHDAFIVGLGLDPTKFDQHLDPRHWDDRSAIVAPIVASKTMRDWTEHYAESDACVTPVLSLEEAAFGPIGQDRETFVIDGKAFQPSPSPRFGGSPLLQRFTPSRHDDISNVIERWSDEHSRVLSTA